MTPQQLPRSEMDPWVISAPPALVQYITSQQSPPPLVQYYPSQQSPPHPLLYPWSTVERTSQGRVGFHMTTTPEQSSFSPGMCVFLYVRLWCVWWVWVQVCALMCVYTTQLVCHVWRDICSSPWSPDSAGDRRQAHRSTQAYNSIL